MARPPESPTATPTPATPPERFDVEPFSFRWCTVPRVPTRAEAAAYAAFHRTCRSAESFWDGAPAADWMLDVLTKAWDDVPVVPEQELRRFAVACAENLTAAAAPAVQDLLDGVRRYLAGAATLDDLVALQARTHPSVAAGGVHGLPRCSTFAAAKLAAWHAADRHPLQAAWWSAEFAARHDAFAILHECAATWEWPEDKGEAWRADWRAAFFSRSHPDVQAAALADARRRQADLLRSILPKPFGTIVRHLPSDLRVH